MKRILFLFFILIPNFCFSQAMEEIIIDLKTGGFIVCTVLPKSIALERLKSIKPQIVVEGDMEYTVFYLQNGKVIEFSNGEYFEYDSRADLDKLIMNQKDGPYGVEILYKENPYNEDFLEHVNDLVEDLCNLFLLDKGAFVDKIDLLKEIDNRIEKGTLRKRDLRQHFLKIVALYIYLFQENNKNVKFVMELSPDNETWYPVRLTASGYKDGFVGDVYEGLILNNRSNEEVFRCVL